MSNSRPLSALNCFLKVVLNSIEKATSAWDRKRYRAISVYTEG